MTTEPWTWLISSASMFGPKSRRYPQHSVPHRRGLRAMRFPGEQPRAMPPAKPMHCSAFAATGPATADGKIVFGHITMFGLYPANFYNVWIDVKTARGHRFVMC